MNLGELATRLSTAGTEFYQRRFTIEIFPKFAGQKITETSVKEFILSFLLQVELPVNVKHIIDKKLNDYAKDALESIKRNDHMNDYVGGDTFDLISAEAILVDFINYACMPLDLGMYTLDLKKKQ